MLVIRKMLARIANREDPDQTASLIRLLLKKQSGPEVIKYFMLNSTEHKISTADKN